jgi:cation diffusion facilitator family transporter
MGTNRVVIASIVANVCIAALKFGAAAATGSSAMFAEGMHSLVDTADGALLLLGEHRSRRPPDESHPFGYGHELYFWAMIVAMLFFTLGGGLTIYEGITRIRNPEPTTNLAWSYAVLGGAALFDGSSFIIGWRQFRRETAGRGFWTTVRASKDPALFSVVLEDVGDMLGIAIAAIAITLAHWLQRPWIDGAGSVGIGLVLVAVAFVLMREVKGLLIGERARRDLIASVRDAAAAEPAILKVHQPLTLQLGPSQVLVGFGAEFDPKLSAADVAAAIDRIESKITRLNSDVTHIYIEAEALKGHH